jgi:hypothetical protein
MGGNMYWGGGLALLKQNNIEKCMENKDPVHNDAANLICVTSQVPTEKRFICFGYLQKQHKLFKKRWLSKYLGEFNQ